MSKPLKTHIDSGLRNKFSPKYTEPLCEVLQVTARNREIHRGGRMVQEGFRATCKRCRREVGTLRRLMHGMSGVEMQEAYMKRRDVRVKRKILEIIRPEYKRLLAQSCTRMK